MHIRAQKIQILQTIKCLTDAEKRIPFLMIYPLLPGDDHRLGKWLAEILQHKEPESQTEITEKFSKSPVAGVEAAG